MDTEAWEQWWALPPGVQDELAAFLDRLTSNPYDPGLLAKCEVDANEHFSYRLPRSSYVFSWRVEADAVPVTGSSLKGMTVEFLEIRAPSQLR